MFKRLVLLATMVAVLSWVLAACGGGESTGTQYTQTPVPPAATSAPSSGGGNVIEVTLAGDEGGSARFEPANFSFKVGEKVRIRLSSQNAFHTFTSKDLPTEEGQEISAFVKAGETVEIQFTPSQAGTFDLICLPHVAAGMKGTITVSQ